jgi:hypothetical protein
MVTGSFASAYYGAPRSTQDIDIVIEADARQLRRLIDLLPPGEYYADIDAALAARTHESMFNVVDFSTGWKIDLIIRKSRQFSRVEFERRRKIILQDLELYAVSSEDLILSKLEWAKRSQSQRQITDAASLLRTRKDLLDRRYLEDWVKKLGLESEWQMAEQNLIS